jgi:hypothetical protein
MYLIKPIRVTYSEKIELTIIILMPGMRTSNLLKIKLLKLFLEKSAYAKSMQTSLNIQHNTACTSFRHCVTAESKDGGLVEWLCSGLQIRVHRFDSGTRLHNI